MGDGKSGFFPIYCTNFRVNWVSTQLVAGKKEAVGQSPLQVGRRAPGGNAMARAGRLVRGAPLGAPCSGRKLTAGDTLRHGPVVPTAKCHGHRLRRKSC